MPFWDVTPRENSTYELTNHNLYATVLKSQNINEVLSNIDGHFNCNLFSFLIYLSFLDNFVDERSKRTIFKTDGGLGVVK